MRLRAFALRSWFWDLWLKTSEVPGRISVAGILRCAQNDGIWPLSFSGGSSVHGFREGEAGLSSFTESHQAALAGGSFVGILRFAQNDGLDRSSARLFQKKFPLSA